MIPSGFHVQIADWLADHADLRAVRDPVFLDEQRVPPEIEADALDPDCHHVLARDDDGNPIGTARLAPGGRIGRMAVLQDWRGRGVGAAMLQTLLDLARDLRHGEVELHAQVDAIGFYERFGFSTEGEEFVEAGIRHRHMRRALAPRAAVPRPPPPPTPPARLVEASSLHEVREALMTLLADARHQLFVLSRDLDPLLLADPEAMEQLRRLARSGPNARLRFLVQEPDAVMREGHPLIGLGQRLSSSIAFRSQVEEPDLQYPSAFVINDRGGYLFRPLASRFEATADRYGPARHRQLREYFSQVWERSETTAAFRALEL
jgi:predicted GNAT family N-acyltransferase